MTAARYALIVGQGRSGTNWLLDLFNASPETFCRNEPDESAGSPFAGLEDHRAIVRADLRLLADGWDQSVAWAAVHMGDRDRLNRHAKHYIRPLSSALGLCRMVQGPKYRRALSVLLPGLRGEAWLMPRWLCRTKAFQNALTILKLNQAPGWACFVFEHRAQIPIFHILRHPGGYLNSWANRYLAEQERDRVRAENLDRLREAARESVEWLDLFGDIGAMSVEESELWYWRYANEMIHRGGQGRANYRAITFEHLAQHPVPIMEELFAVAGIEWNRGIAETIEQECEDSTTLAENWRTSLVGSQIELVERIMGTSPLKALWNSTDNAH